MAKRALQGAATPIRRGQRIAPAQVLLQLLDLDPPDPAAELFAAVGVNRSAARDRIWERLAAA